ncbi:MAG: hypothetical protein ACRC1Z_17585 [Waterburya sp.]
MRLKNIEQEREQDKLMLSLFLDFVMENALRNPNEIKKYTEEMADEDDELIEGVIIDS